MSDDWKEVTAVWQGGLGFIGKNNSGGSVQMGIVENQAGVSPMEVLLLGLAGCTGMDVASILSKMRQNMTAFQITVRGNRSSDHPRVYQEIKVIYQLWGDNLDQKSVENAIELSEVRYCSVSAMLREAAKIRSSYIIYSSDNEILHETGENYVR